jgi:DNA mismatch repair protein MutS
MARDIATRVRAFALFATHYFELTTLAAEVEGCANVHLDATEHGDGIVFLHAVKDGPANRSYGLQVAQLAGVPLAVIREARGYLEALESQREAQRHRSDAPATPQAELPLFLPDAVGVQLRDALEALDPDTLTPRDALDALYRLRSLLRLRRSGGPS